MMSVSEPLAKPASEPHAGGDVCVEPTWLQIEIALAAPENAENVKRWMAALSSSAGPAEPFGYVATTGRGRDYFQRDAPEIHTLGTDWTVTSVYAHPAPATVEMIERAAQAAEGPEFWPHPKQTGDRLTYRGTKDGNWLAVKPPFKLDPYSQGRADAAAAVRALAPATEGRKG